MAYLLTKIIFCLLLAGILGAIIGWLLKKLSSDKKWGARYQSLEDEKENIQSLLGEYEEKSSRQDSDIKKLASEVTLKDRDNLTLAKSFSSLQANRNDLKTEIGTLNLKLNETQAYSTELETKNTALNNELEKAQEENKRIEELEAIISDLNNSQTNLQQELTNSENTNEEIEKKMADLGSTHSTLEEKYTALTQDNTQVQTELTTSQQTLKDSEEALDQLETQNQSLLSKLEAIGIQLNTSKKEAADLQAFKATSDKKQNTTQNEIQELKTQIERYQKTANDSAQELLKAKNAAENTKSLNATIMTLTSERDQLSQNIQQDNATRKTNKVDMDNLKKEIQSLESEKSTLQNELSHARQSNSELDNLKSKLSKLETEKETEKKKLLADLKSTQQSASTVKELEKQLAKQKTKMQEKQATVISDKEELQRYKDYLLKAETRWAAEVKDLRQELTAKETAQEIAIQKASEASKSLNVEFNTKIQNLNSERDQLNTKLKQTQTEHDKVTAQHSSLEAKLITLKNQLKLAADERNQLLNTAAAESKAFQTKIQTITNERDLLSKNYKKSSAEHTNASDKTSQAQILLEAEIKQLKETVKQTRIDAEKAKHEFRKQSQSDIENQKLKAQIKELQADLTKAKKKTSPNLPTHNKVNLLSSKQATTENNAQKQKKPKVSTTHTQSKKVRYPIEAIEGIGVVYGKRLRNINVNFVDTLLNKGKNPAGRKSLAERTDINKDLILTWVNHADLFRIDGVEGDYAELLEASGVDTVKALRNRNATNLTKKMISVNKEKRLAPQAPAENEVNDWIAHAARLKPMLTYGGTSFTSTVKATPKKATAKKTAIKADDLKKIKGVGKVNEKILHAQGITTFAQIANFTPQDEEKYGEKLNSFHERISQEEWVKQAKALHKSKYG